MWRVTLFIAGPSARAERVASQLRQVCAHTVGTGGYVLDVVDLSAHPHRRCQDDIVMVPAAVCTSPDGVTFKAVGDFSDLVATAEALGLPNHDGTSRE